MIDIERVKQHLNLDIDTGDTDTVVYLQFLMDTVEQYVDACVGTNYKTVETKDKLADLLKLKLITDMWENRGTSEEGNIKRDRITETIMQSLAIAGGTV